MSRDGLRRQHLRSLHPSNDGATIYRLPVPERLSITCPHCRSGVVKTVISVNITALYVDGVLQRGPLPAGRATPVWFTCEACNGVFEEEDVPPGTVESVEAEYGNYLIDTWSQEL